MGAPSYVRTRATTHAQRESIPIELAVWSRPVPSRDERPKRAGRDRQIQGSWPPLSPVSPRRYSTIHAYTTLHPIRLRGRCCSGSSDVCQCSKYPSGWRVMAVTA